MVDMVVVIRQMSRSSLDYFLCVYMGAVVPKLSGSPQWDCLRVSKR